MTTLDAVRLLPGEPELAPLVERARTIFERVEARRFLAALDRALAAGGPAVAARPAADRQADSRAAIPADQEPATRP